MDTRHPREGKAGRDYHWQVVKQGPPVLSLRPLAQRSGEAGLGI
jgi:hypothetical protein